MRLAADHASTWVAVDGRDATLTSIEKLRGVCQEQGRDFETLGRLALTGFLERPLASRDAFLDVVGRYEEMGFTELVVHWPRAEEPFAASRSVLEEIAPDVDRLNRI